MNIEGIAWAGFWIGLGLAISGNTQVLNALF